MSSLIYSRSSPYSAKIHLREPLTKPESSKATYHIVLDIKGSNLSFKVGDSVGICPQNDSQIVNAIISMLGSHADNEPFRLFLSHKAALNRISSSCLKTLLLYSKKRELQPLLQEANRPALLDYLSSYDLLEILNDLKPVECPLELLMSELSPLLPRFYSVASSPLVHPDEIHLTVSLTSFERRGRIHFGVASHFLCHLTKVGDAIPLYVQPTHGFNLIENSNLPIIMIGPGTGIAPFRGFLQERLALNAKGKNWLFFGERNQATDFLYQPFLKELENEGILKLDTAFSRDQEQRLYVQHKMIERGDELWAWLQEGAVIYVCGDAERMAKDVQAAWHHIACMHGNMSIDQAKIYFKTLRSQKRYLIDVY